MALARIAFMLGLASTSWAQARSSVEGRVLKLTRESEIFAAASGKSKVLADADRDTILILRKVSPKKNWLLVEDEERNQGWVPRNRTDYVDVPPPRAEAASRQDDNSPASGIRREEERFEEEEGRREIPSSWQHGFAAVGRKSLFDINGKWAGGLQYSLLTPPRPIGERAYRTGFLTGYYRSDLKGFSVPLRYRLLAGSGISSWASGPDVGLLLMKSVAGGVDWSAGLGYTLQWSPFSSSGLFTSFRMGLDFHKGTRFSYELSVGYFL